MKTCMCCGRETNHGLKMFCESPKCLLAKVKHTKAVQKAWKKRNKHRIHAYREKHHPRKLLLPKGPKVFSGYDKVKGLEQAPRPIMERILDKGLDMFSDRDQVELVFLESQHLRGHRDPVMATVSQECGGQIWGGIFPNRGTRL